jgi:hypothetical protein
VSLSKVSLSSMLDGVWRLDGHLDALDGEILDTALRLAAGSDDTEAPRTPAQRRADALVNIAKRFLDHEEQPPARRNRPHVNVIVTRDDLEAGRGGECADGTVLDGPSLASLVCDSTMHRVVMAGSVILDYGTATRTISPNRFNATAASPAVTARRVGPTPTTSSMWKTAGPPVRAIASCCVDVTTPACTARAGRPS